LIRGVIEARAVEGLVDVEQWAELRREHFVRGVSIKQLVSRTGLSRNTVRAALRAPEPPKYQREPAGSKLDPFKEEIHKLLRGDAELTGQRIRELIAPLGFEGGKTIVDDYLREVRPFFVDRRTFQRTVYRPGEICQFDVWEPRVEIPVGHGQTRQAWVVVACLGYSRAGAGAVIFSKQTPDLLLGIRRCLWSLGALPQTLVWDRQAGLHASGGRPTVEFAGFCGALKVDWHFCEPRDPQAKGVVERLQDFMERSFEPGRCFAMRHIVHESGRNGRIGRSGCCHGCCRGSVARSARSGAERGPPAGHAHACATTRYGPGARELTPGIRRSRDVTARLRYHGQSAGPLLGNDPKGTRWPSNPTGRPSPPSSTTPRPAAAHSISHASPSLARRRER
jgi:transposase